MSALFDQLVAVSAEENGVTEHDSGYEYVVSAVASRHLVLDHQIFDGTNGWRTSETRKHPSLTLLLSTDKTDYDRLHVPFPQVVPSKVLVITDTGAQSSLMGIKPFLECGLSRTQLISVNKRMYAANNEGINILGAILVRLSGRDSRGTYVETAEMVYVTDSTNLFYPSRHAMEQLSIIVPDFPKVGGAVQAAIEVGDGIATAECGCPLRQRAPPRPMTLPFEAKTENIPRMKQWLLARNAAPTFNNCPHQKLLLMKDDPPMEAYIDPNAVPKVVHTPVTTPLHWQMASQGVWLTYKH